MTAAAHLLARWAVDLRPTYEDLVLADRSLLDTMAVMLAARNEPVTTISRGLPEGARWAVTGHVLDFDDLHMPSTAHVSVVCVPTSLALDGGPRAYLAAAGVMARLGSALGWKHYSAGWHATCTASTQSSTAGAAVALGLSVREVANAIALAIPGAGGVQRAFGTDAKSLQVGFAVESGIRAARLAAAGGGADLSVVDAWLPMVGGTPAALNLSGPAVPGGLAIKIYPCCYALQRPISALSEFVGPELRPETIRRIVIRTRESTVVPLIHHQPDSGLQGKFSLEYAAAAALLDRYPGFTSFTDAAVRREAARQLTGKVEVILDPGGSWLLDGQLDAELYTSDGVIRRTSLQSPPGSPDRPPYSEQLKSKLAECTRGLETDPETWTWHNAASTLRRFLQRPA